MSETSSFFAKKPTLSKIGLSVFFVITVVAVSYALFFRKQQITKQSESIVTQNKLDQLEQENLIYEYPPIDNKLFHFCVLEKVNFLKENQYIQISNQYFVTIIGKCSYHDNQDNYQSLSLALSIEDWDNAYTWVAGLIPQNGIIDPSFRPTYFAKSAKIEENDILVIGFDYPDQNKKQQPLLEGNQAIINLHHTFESIDLFAQTRDPNQLNKFLIPTSITIFGS